MNQMAIDKTYKQRLKNGEKLLFVAIQPSGRDLIYLHEQSKYPHGALHVNSDNGGTYIHLTKSLYNELINIQSGDEFVMWFDSTVQPYGRFVVEWNPEEVDGYVPFAQTEPNYSVNTPTPNQKNRPPAPKEAARNAPASPEKSDKGFAGSEDWDSRLEKAVEGFIKGAKTFRAALKREMPDLEVDANGLFYGLSCVNMTLVADKNGQNTYEMHHLWDNLQQKVNSANQDIVKKIVETIANDVGEEVVETDEKVLGIFNYIIEEETGQYVGHQNLSTLTLDELEVINNYIRKGGSIQEHLQPTPF